MQAVPVEMSVSPYSKVQDLDDFASVYEPLSKDGAFVPFRPRAVEDLQEPYSNERSSARVRYTAVTGHRVRRLVSVAKGREAMRQRAAEVLLAVPPVKNKEEETVHSLRVGLAGLEVKQDVDTEAEDSEEVTDAGDPGRPTFFGDSHQAPDGCHHLLVQSKGPLHLDEPPDFLQLPEPIKQRTAGAARVAAAARAWAAASAPGSRQVASGTAMLIQYQAGDVAPPTARGVPEQQPRQEHRAVQVMRATPPEREAVAGPAVLALRRMRNRMSALAEVAFSSPRDREPRRPLMPNLGRTAAPANSTRGAASGSGADDSQMQSLVPTPPTEPKPNGSRFWKRPWPRMNIMSTLGFSSNSEPSAAGSRGASSSDRPGPAARQDPTPSSAAGSSPP